MYKEVKVHIYNGISLSHEKEWNCIIVMMWINLESVIQSEVSQKEKNKYCMLTHIYGIQKNGVMNLFAEKQQRYGDSDMENGLVDTVGEGDSGTNGENSIDIYTLQCVKQIADKKLLYNAGNPAWLS